MQDQGVPCPFYDVGSHLMQMWDVGASSAFVQEAEALAALAAVLGRSDDSQTMSKSASAMRSRIAAWLWDESQGVFVNRFRNGTFSRRVSPTSFYALMAGAATDAQAERMVKEWLLSPNGFCVSSSGNFSGNDDGCWWGLPSIAASDPAYALLGYWRGYQWGPMAQFVYWGLQRYAHIPIVEAARAAMVEQLRLLMLSQWRIHRHICENYDPRRNATECSGTQFYHWGALNGLLSLIDAGHAYPTRAALVKRAEAGMVRETALKPSMAWAHASWV